MAIEALTAEPKLSALIVHGWNDNPSEGWLGWLAMHLQAGGYEVHAPHLQINKKPLMKHWSEQIQLAARNLDGDSIIIAHSLGCFLTLRLLESLVLAKPIRRVILVSGFYDAPNDSASKFFLPEPEWTKIKSQATDFICIGSIDDTIVTPDRTRRLAHKLEATLVMLADKGHFLGSRGMRDFPELLEYID